MEQDDVIDRLNELDKALFGDRIGTLLGRSGPPFDISRPNIHENKKEFLREYEAVKAVLGGCSAATSALFNQKTRKDPDHQEMLTRLSVAIDGRARQALSRTILATADDLARKNLAETGFFYNSVFVLLDMQSCYEQRLKELEDQEKQYWNVPHRPPNYYARTIALRFARHFARERRIKPTFGTSRDGGHPSTDYGRALEKVFEILEISADVRGAARWAIGQLTEDDWNPPLGNALADSVINALTATRPQADKPRNALAEITNALQKKLGD